MLVGGAAMVMQHFGPSDVGTMVGAVAGAGLLIGSIAGATTSAATVRSGD